MRVDVLVALLLSACAPAPEHAVQGSALAPPPGLTLELELKPIALPCASLVDVWNVPANKQVVLIAGTQEGQGPCPRGLGGCVDIVDPVVVINEWGLDAFRFYVLRELEVGPDGNWTDAGFKSRYQSELANGLGNLVNRSLSMLKRYRNGVVPTRSDELAADAEKVVAETRERLEANQLQGALVSIWSLVTRANQYVDQTKPFSLAKDPAQAQRLDAVLYNLVETCRVLAVLLWPFIPNTATKIYAQLGLNHAPENFSAAMWGGLQLDQKIGEPAPLFPRKDA